MQHRKGRIGIDRAILDLGDVLAEEMSELCIISTVFGESACCCSLSWLRLDHKMAKLHFGLSALLLCPSALAQSPIDETISKIWSSKVQLAADMSQFAGASSVLREMAHMPSPSAHVGSLDPAVPAAQCDRDFGMLCPSKFVNIGPVKGGQDAMCAGSEDCC